MLNSTSSISKPSSLIKSKNRSKNFKRNAISSWRNSSSTSNPKRSTDPTCQFTPKNVLPLIKSSQNVNPTTTPSVSTTNPSPMSISTSWIGNTTNAVILKRLWWIRHRGWIRPGSGWLNISRRLMSIMWFCCIFTLGSLIASSILWSTRMLRRR